MGDFDIFPENTLHSRGLQPNPRMKCVEHTERVVERDHWSKVHGLDKSIRREPGNVVTLRRGFLTHVTHQFAAHVYRWNLLLCPMAKSLP
jgi:hypothetical protein